jgi:glucose-1-phosphate cytidylyltransferase
MDTFKDKQRLEELNETTAPWKVWSAAQAFRQPLIKAA